LLHIPGSTAAWCLGIFFFFAFLSFFLGFSVAADDDSAAADVVTFLLFLVLACAEATLSYWATRKQYHRPCRLMQSSVRRLFVPQNQPSMEVSDTIYTIDRH
jgi:hypothetical protein